MPVVSVAAHTALAGHDSAGRTRNDTIDGCYRISRPSLSASAEKTLSVSSPEQPSGNTAFDMNHLQAEEDYYLGEAGEKDLVWVPSWSNYIHRHLSKPRIASRLDIQVPTGFPSEITGPAVWEGDQLASDPSRWVVNLGQEDIQEIEDAVESIVALGVDLKDIGQHNFDLPRLGPKLKQFGESLYEGGPGLFLLRGLNPDKYSPLQNVVAYVGIASYVAEERGVQDERQNMLLHLKDLKDTAAAANLRQAPYSNVEQPFHTDGAEVIGLYTISPATKGGRSKLASFGHVYNHIASTRPELIHVLAAKKWVFDRFNDELPPARAIFFPPNDICKVPTMQMARRPLTGSEVSPRSAHLPKLTNAQIDALDTLHFTAEASALYVELKKGDMVFWNNYRVLHGREGFQDSDPSTNEKATGRHLIRLWLRKSGGGVGGEIEELLKEQGVYEPRQQENWPVEPITDFTHITTKLRSCGYA